MNPFNGIESRSSRSILNDVTLSFANPFNGIESVPPLTPLDGSQESSNPFNGIEREVDPCTERGNPLRNPFNGIERKAKNIQGKQNEDIESIQWN